MKALNFISTILLAMMLLVSCGGGDDPVAPDKPIVPERPTEPSITVPSGEKDYFSKGITFDTNAGEQDFTFQTDADWTISVASTRSGESWCSVSPTSGKAGKHTVKVRTEANTTYDNRQVTLTLATGSTKKTIAITQKQQDALTLTKDKFEIDSEGGTIEIEVKANIIYEAIISETSKGWISKSNQSRGLTASTLVFTIAESEESDKREGEIIIKSGNLSETVHVYQTGKKILLLNQNEFNVTAEGDTIQVEIKSNFNFGVSMPQVDWIIEMKNSRTLSSHTLNYIIKANETYDNRKAKIFFFDKESGISETLTIIQSKKSTLPRLKSIKSTGSENKYTINFTYDKEKLSQYIWIYDDYENDVEFNQSISYYDNKVIMKGEVDSYYTTQTYLLNKKGQATSCTYSREGRDIKTTFEYSPDDYLTKVVITETKLNNHQIDITSANFNYSQDNNLIEGKETYSYSSGSSTKEFTQLYGSELNELGIMDYFTFENTLFDYQAAFYAGILGRPCKNLVNIYTDDNFKANFSFSLNQDEKYLEQNASGKYGYWETKKYFYE